MRLWVLAAALVAAVAGAGRVCEPISIPLCKNIGYNMTSYPNSYGHEKQEEAGLEVHQFFPLVEVGCYQHLKFFLCAMYTPICQENYDRPLLPCMELCLEAKKRCSPIMQRYGFRWPETLSCDVLPKMSEQMLTGNICAAPPDTPKQNKKKPASSLSIPPELLRPQVAVSSVEDADCECRCSRPFRTVESARSVVGNVTGCAYACHAEGSSEQSRQLVTSWMAVWSITCFVLSAFTLLTFLIETDRFQYPERPIFMLAFCQMMVAIGFIIRVFHGHDSVACDAWRIRDEAAGSGSSCFVVFLLLYFFSQAAAAWWVCVSLCWLLAAGLKWSSEAIGGYAKHFHIVAWTVPAIQTALVLAFNAVDGDPVSGICYVGNTDVVALRLFVLVPLVVYFSIGVFLLFIGFVNLWSIRSEVQKQHPGLDNASKLTQLMSKIGIFSLLYTVPALLSIVAHFYEQRERPRWETARTCPCAAGVDDGYADAQLLLALVKTASLCVAGWTTGVWITSGKTLTSWKNFLCCLGGGGGGAKYEPADVMYAKSDISAHFYNTTLRQHSHQGYYPPEKL